MMRQSMAKEASALTMKPQQHNGKEKLYSHGEDYSTDLTSMLTQSTRYSSIESSTTFGSITTRSSSAGFHRFNASYDDANSSSNSSGAPSPYRGLLRQHEEMMREGAAEALHTDTCSDSCCFINGSSDGCTRGRRNSLPSKYLSDITTDVFLLPPPPLLRRSLQETKTDSDQEPSCQRLQRSQSLCAAAAISSSPPFTVTAMNHQDVLTNAPSIPKLTSFYQAALEEATITEEEEEQLLQQQRLSMLGHEEIANDVAISCSSNLTESSYSDGSDCSASHPLTTATISPFYKAAIEDSVCLEEEELLLLHRKQEDEGINEPLTLATTISTECAAVDSTPSAFYQSALEEAAMAMGELEVDGNTAIAANHLLGDGITQHSITRSVLYHGTNHLSLQSTRDLAIHPALLSTGKEQFCEDLDRKERAFKDDHDDSSRRPSLYSEGQFLANEDCLDNIHNHQKASAVTEFAVSEDPEFLMSQLKALEEYERENPRKKDGDFDDRTSSSSSTLSRKPKQQRRRSRLEAKGSTKTREAISNGNAHVIKCKGCLGRLQAPLHFSLVFCPKCQTVSPA